VSFAKKNDEFTQKNQPFTQKMSELYGTKKALHKESLMQIELKD
jgi:hypothetical protein